MGDRLFGRSLRLRVAVWILERGDPTFYQAEVGKGVDEPSPSNPVQELNRLVELGMLQRVDKMPGERRQYYARTQSPLWEVVRAAREVLLEDSEAGAPP